MTIQGIVDVLRARVVYGEDMLNKEIEYAFASDLMSDVLTLQIRKFVLITGLANLQTIRTAEMADVRCIVLVRNKKVSPEMINLARQNNIILLEYEGSMFRASGMLFNAGIKPVY
jgi:hypothetical protein